MPVKLLFDPRTENEDEFLSVSISEAVFTNDHATSNELSGLLIRYSLIRNEVTALWDSTIVSASSLNIFCGGQRLLAVQGKKPYPAYRKVMIFDANDLELLHELPPVPTANIGGITPLYSYSYRHLALIIWKKFTGSTITNLKQLESDCNKGEDESNICSMNLRQMKSSRHLCPVQVSIYKLKLNLENTNLQELTSTVILRVSKPTKITRLPLPTSLQKMLLGVKRC